MLRVTMMLLAFFSIGAFAQSPQELRQKGVQSAMQEDFQGAERYLCEAARMGFYTAQLECAYLLQSSPEPVKDPIAAYAWAMVVIERDGTDTEFAQWVSGEALSDLSDEEKSKAEQMAKEYIGRYVE